MKALPNLAKSLRRVACILFLVLSAHGYSGEILDWPSSKSLGPNAIASQFVLADVNKDWDKMHTLLAPQILKFAPKPQDLLGYASPLDTTGFYSTDSPKPYRRSSSNGVPPEMRLAFVVAVTPFEGKELRVTVICMLIDERWRVITAFPSRISNLFGVALQDAFRSSE